MTRTGRITPAGLRTTEHDSPLRLDEWLVMGCDVSSCYRRPSEIPAQKSLAGGVCSYQ